jgi:hypothetical protein
LVYQAAFWVFGLVAAHRWAERFAFEFFDSGITVVDGVLPVGGPDGSAVSCGPVQRQG